VIFPRPHTRRNRNETTKSQWRINYLIIDTAQYNISMQQWLITQCFVNVGLMLGRASLFCNSSQAPVLILRQASHLGQNCYIHHMCLLHQVFCSSGKCCSQHAKRQSVSSIQHSRQCDTLSNHSLNTWTTETYVSRCVILISSSFVACNSRLHSARGRPNVTLIVSAETETRPKVYALHSAETESRPKV